MIDLHSHILPGVDDGPSDWDGALAMLAMAERAGTTTIVATPHSHDYWRAATPSHELIPQLVREAQARARQAGLQIEVVPGQECQLLPDLPADLLAGHCLPLGASRTVLVELPFTVWPPFTESLIFELQVAGYVVLLAHPERYRAVQEEPNTVLPLVERGVLTQVTTTSLLGRNGSKARETAELLVEHNLAHLIASDAHGTGGRSPTLDAAFEQVASWMGQDIATRLCVEVPRALLRDEAPPLLEPLRVEPRRRKFFGLI